MPMARSSAFPVLVTTDSYADDKMMFPCVHEEIRDGQSGGGYDIRDVACVSREAAQTRVLATKRGADDLFLADAEAAADTPLNVGAPVYPVVYRYP